MGDLLDPININAYIRIPVLHFKPLFVRRNCRKSNYQWHHTLYRLLNFHFYLKLYLKACYLLSDNTECLQLAPCQSVIRALMRAGHLKSIGAIFDDKYDESEKLPILPYIWEIAVECDQ